MKFSLRLPRASKKVLGLFISASCLLTQSAFADDAKLSAQLQQVLGQTTEAIPVVVMLRQLPPLPVSVWGKVPRNQVEVMMKQQILKSQDGIRKQIQGLINLRTIDGEPSVSRYKPFWNINGVMLTAKSDVIYDLSEREDVAFIQYDYKIKLERDYRHFVDLDGAEYTYGLQKIGVNKIRESNPDLNGKGVVVGILDTGIDGAHPEFAGKKINFKDFVGTQTKPYDDNGHGTHCAGTISGVGAGGTQIGVAPGIEQLVVGKVFSSSGSASLSGLLRAMEWIADPDANPNTADQPRVISNSWGGGPVRDADADPFGAAILTWVQLNIFPSFAAGNAGPGAGSVSSPGGLPQSFAVGATDSNDKIASFSSRGPADMTKGGKQIRLVKPDVSAPGVEVLSAMPDGKYGKMSGTSMATPHNTGAVALLLQAKPDLTVAQIRELMEKNADHLGDDGKNNNFGAGRINVAKSLMSLSQFSVN